MRYSAYKRKSDDGLYILHDSYAIESIYAVSESKELLERYKNQFRTYRDNPDIVKITHITDRYQVHQLYKLYFDTLFVEEFKKDIVVTLQEVKYYTKILMDIYDSMKTMIGQLLLNERLLNLNSDEIVQTHKTFVMYYDKCKSFQEFVELIDPKVFINEYLVEPMVAKNMNDLDDEYHKIIGRDN